MDYLVATAMIDAKTSRQRQGVRNFWWFGPAVRWFWRILTSPKIFYLYNCVRNSAEGCETSDRVNEVVVFEPSDFFMKQM